MSTRQTKMQLGPIHVFRDIVKSAHYIDIGTGSYNRAWQIWPLTLRRLY